MRGASDPNYRHLLIYPAKLVFVRVLVTAENDEEPPNPSTSNASSGLSD